MLTRGQVLGVARHKQTYGDGDDVYDDDFCHGSNPEPPYPLLPPSIISNFPVAEIEMVLETSPEGELRYVRKKRGEP